MPNLEAEMILAEHGLFVKALPEGELPLLLPELLLGIVGRPAVLDHGRLAVGQVPRLAEDKQTCQHLGQLLIKFVPFSVTSSSLERDLNPRN